MVLRMPTQLAVHHVSHPQIAPASVDQKPLAENGRRRRLRVAGEAVPARQG